jgi:HlyD family secretion protein
MRMKILILATICLTSCGPSHSTAPLVQSPIIATAEGRVDSADEARHLVAAVDGVINRVFVTRGQQVARGDALLAINCGHRQQDVTAHLASADQAVAAERRVRQSEKPSEIAAANAQVAAAQSLVLEQEQRLSIAADLKDRGFVSNREFAARSNSRDAARADLAAASANRAQLNDASRRPEIAEARAAVNVAAAKVGVARALAGQCILNSPTNGTVLQLLRKEGEFSGASQGIPLIIVADLSRLVVRAEINERDAIKVSAGQRAKVWVDGNQTRWPGRVTLISSIMGRRTARSLDPTDRFDRDTREVFIDFDGPQPPALVGLRVTVGLLK